MLLLLVFLLEATVTVLFFAYTDKVQSPSAPPPHPPASGVGSDLTARGGATALWATRVQAGLGMAVTSPTLSVGGQQPLPSSHWGTRL